MRDPKVGDKFFFKESNSLCRFNVAGPFTITKIDCYMIFTKLPNRSFDTWQTIDDIDLLSPIPKYKKTKVDRFSFEKRKK